MSMQRLDPGGAGPILAARASPSLDEGWLHVIAETIPQIVWTADHAGNFDSANQRWVDFTGRTLAESAGDGWHASIYEPDRASTVETWKRSVETGAPYDTEHRIIRGSDGSHRWHLCRAVPFRDAGGHIVKWFGTSTDIDDQKRAAAVIREQYETVESLYSVGRIIAGELDLEKVVQTVTDAATRLSGAQFGAFFYDLSDDAGDRLTLYTISGVPREHFSKFPMPRKTKIFAPTFEGQDVVRIADVTKDPRYGHNPPHHGMPGGHLPVKSYLAVPVVSRVGGVIGALFFGHELPGVFDERAEKLAVGLAAQAAVALDNAHLFREANRAVRAKEDALTGTRLERERLRDLFAQAPVAIAVTRGPDHVFESSNELYRQVVGRNPDGKPLRQAFPELEGQGVFEAIDSVYRSGTAFIANDYPARLDRAGDGRLTEGWFNFIYQPLHDQAGTISGCMLLAYEVTDHVVARKRIEALAAEHEQARKLLADRTRYLALSSDVGQLLATRPGLDDMLQRSAVAIVTHLGAAFARVWTLNVPEQVLEMRASAGMYTHLNGPHGRVPVGKFKIGRIAQSAEPHLSNDVLNDPHVGDHDWARREGMVSFAGYPLMVEGKVYGVVALFSREPMPEETFHAVRSVADSLAMGVQRKFGEEAQKRLIDALERSNQQLGRSNSELDQFAYVASHDLKAPLRGIANLAQWIEEDLGAEVPDGLREKMRLLHGRVHRMEALIDGILDYSRAGRVRHKPERVEVGRLLTEVIELIAPPPGVSIAVAPEMPVLDTEKVPLQQVFMNLVGNAVKHSRRGDAQVQASVREDGPFYQFTVADNGQGVAPEFHDRIWGIFQTLEARDKVEGTGIGLSVVKKIVESRGGRTWIESAEGKGAAFHFTWPKVEA